MQKWEYMTITIVDSKILSVNGKKVTEGGFFGPLLGMKGQSFIEGLNILGKEGWEAIGISNVATLSTGNILLKRPIA